MVPLIGSEVICIWCCWSLCENRFAGTTVGFVLLAWYCATVMGWTSAPRLKISATLPDYLGGKCEDPSAWFVNSYPTLRVKRLLRFLFDRF